MRDKRLLTTQRAGQQILALKSTSVCKLNLNLKPMNSALYTWYWHVRTASNASLGQKVPQPERSSTKHSTHQFPVFPKNLMNAVLTDLFSLKLCQAEQGQPQHWLCSPIYTSSKSRLVSWPLFLDYLTCQWPSKITMISTTEVELISTSAPPNLLSSSCPWPS